jgi:hypothetical protein
MIVAVVFLPPYDSPWLIESTAPGPGDSAIAQQVNA